MATSADSTATTTAQTGARAIAVHGGGAALEWAEPQCSRNRVGTETSRPNVWTKQCVMAMSGGPVKAHSRTIGCMHTQAAMAAADAAARVPCAQPLRTRPPLRPLRHTRCAVRCTEPTPLSRAAKERRTDSKQRWVATNKCARTSRAARFSTKPAPPAEQPPASTSGVSSGWALCGAPEATGRMRHTTGRDPR